MDISEYRTQFASFNSSLELSRHQNHVGLKPEFTVAELYLDYSDLFSASAIADLKAQLEHTANDRETEKSGLARLLNAARAYFVEVNAQEVTKELEHCELASQIQWKGEKVAFHEVLSKLAREANDVARDELASRWVDSIPACNDLRAAELETLNGSARALGFDSYRALRLETTASHPERETAVSQLREQTESGYKNALASLVTREFPQMSPSRLSFSDLLFLEAIPWVDKRLTPRNLPSIYTEMLAAIGIRLDQKRSIEVEFEPSSDGNRSAACFPVNPPLDVRMVAPARLAASAFLDGMGCWGQALYYVWTSQDRARRYPEFVFSPDPATREAYGYLFRYLAADPRWISEFVPGLNEAQAVETARAVGLNLAIRVRSLSANASCLADWQSIGDQELNHWQPTYADLHQKATSSRRSGELCLVDLNFKDEPLAGLRALAFAFVLREYLRVRYGYRWWSIRKAGDELIDFWDTAGRYSVEELASQIGFGELSFDILIEAVNVALGGA